MRRTRFTAVVLTALFAVLSCLAAASASTTTTIKSANGQTLTASKTVGLAPKGSWVTVSGRGYDERIGIYVTYCKLVKPGKVPTPCGAGIDMTGSTHTSVWVSSNAPLPLRPLVTEFSPGGKFKVRIKVIAVTSEINCLKYRCAIVTKSDHLNLDSTKNNVVMPITFAKKGTK